MTFDQAILVWCVVVPGCIAAAALFVAGRVEARFGNITVAVGWWIALAAALAGRHGWQWWPDDAWRQAIWPILAWAVLLSGSATVPSSVPATGDQQRSWRWVLAGVLACLTALVAMPSGEGWSDTFHLHRIWMCAVATSCLLNSFSIECMARRGAQRWCLFVALAGLGGPMVLAAATYASLGEWTLAVIVATLVTAGLGIFTESLNAWVTAFPVLATAAGIATAARFYSYEEYPIWIYVDVLYGPTVVAGVDCTLRGRATWLRVTISVLISLAMVGSCVWGVLLR